MAEEYQPIPSAEEFAEFARRIDKMLNPEPEPAELPPEPVEKTVPTPEPSNLELLEEKALRLLIAELEKTEGR